MALLRATLFATALIPAALRAPAPAVRLPGTPTPVVAAAARPPQDDFALTFDDFEDIRKWFGEYDAELTRITEQPGGWGGLASDPAGQTGVRNTQKELRELLRVVGDRRASTDIARPILEGLRALFESVRRDIYRNGTVPAPLAGPANRITQRLLDRLALQLDEYYRRFFIKYGDASERLNLLEMVLTEDAFTNPTINSVVAMPTHWEFIAREQVIGYQYEPSVGGFRPSSPVTQLGMSYYFFANNTVARLVNHLGVAAAYQHDMLTHADLWGAVVHLRTIDLAAFCPTKGACRPVIATSVNVQLVRRFF